MDTTTKPKIAQEILEKIQTGFLEEKQVIVHCCLPALPFFGSLVRVWPTTFLIDEEHGHRSTLVHAENIGRFPDWTEVPPMQDFWFTLIFTGLPNSCTHFSLIEFIPQQRGFMVDRIPRNKTDIYRIDVS